MVTRQQFETLISACEEQIKGYLYDSPQLRIGSSGHYHYRFEWVDSGEGMVVISFLDAQGDQTQWDTQIVCGYSDVWSPFDVSLATMWAVLQAEKLHKERFPDSFFTGDSGTIL